MRRIAVLLLMLVLPIYAGYATWPTWCVLIFGAGLAIQNLFSVESYNWYRKPSGFSAISLFRIFAFGLVWNTLIVGAIFGVTHLISA
jgi:hypothetical protein